MTPPPPPHKKNVKGGEKGVWFDYPPPPFPQLEAASTFPFLSFSSSLGGGGGGGGGLVSTPTPLDRKAFPGSWERYNNQSFRRYLRG